MTAERTHDDQARTIHVAVELGLPGLLQDGPWHWRAWEQLAHSVRTGEASFDVANGVSFWQLTQQNPQARELFNHAMGSVSLAEGRRPF
ncbi:hypothetical protein IPZ58_32745 [Streptomyces roseoverticillatus]|uniref:hypothetical protein n=1 Tax=Streptomyces roseoverticillatus TaxID=66429 RepID=UPI001F2B825E|nr:hypothetical protein [Streptomyces roseoverticillatus]MCF3106304.1 hypothetical protein [Streptomyces roseoverticillatus]